MSTTQTILLLIGIAAVVVLLAVLGWYQLKRQSLRKRFGPEYDRVVGEQQDRSAAERELRDREERHAKLVLKELSPKDQQWYADQWQQLQSRFIDAPNEAVVAAQQLVTRLLSDRGYAAPNHEEQLALLSVKHANVVSHYREAHAILEAQATEDKDTEQLRAAILHYHAVVTELSGKDPVNQDTYQDTPRS